MTVSPTASSITPLDRKACWLTAVSKPNCAEAERAVLLFSLCSTTIPRPSTTR